MDIVIFGAFILGAIVARYRTLFGLDDGTSVRELILNVFQQNTRICKETESENKVTQENVSSAESLQIQT